MKRYFWDDCFKLPCSQFKSVKDYSNSNLHSCNTISSWKKMIKKRHYGNESLGLAWDCVKVCQVSLFRTNWDCCYFKLNFSQALPIKVLYINNACNIDFLVLWKCRKNFATWVYFCVYPVFQWCDIVVKVLPKAGGLEKI